MKRLWKLIGASVLALAMVFPRVAGAQQNPLPAQAGPNAADPALKPAATTPVAPVDPPTIIPDAPHAAPAGLSPWAGEIAKLARAGVQDEVILTYIDGTEGTFNLTADQIIYLKNLGVSGPAIAAMMRHDGDVNSGIRTVAASTVPSSQQTLHIVFTHAPTPLSAEPKPAKDSSAEPTDDALADTITAGDWPETVEPGEAYPGNPAGLNAELGSFDSQSGMVQARAAGLSRTYPVRQPYAEEVTGPILVFKASGRTPNVVIVEFTP